MNEFLQTRSQIDEATRWLQKNGYVNHPISAKDWELCHVTSALQDGHLLDMGADGSFVLHNAIIKKIRGAKVGVDLIEVTGTNRAKGADYFVADLMNTGLTYSKFDTISCLSVLEHQVNFTAFAKETSRLLSDGGNLYVSFDYAPKKINTSLTKLYSLDWNILSLEDAVELIDVCAEHGLRISGPVNWAVKDMVINPTYCSPVQGVSYTVGIFHFIKDKS